MHDGIIMREVYLSLQGSLCWNRFLVNVDLSHIVKFLNKFGYLFPDLNFKHLYQSPVSLLNK